SASGKKPLALRAPKPGDLSNADLRRVPRTCPETEVIVDMRIHALAKDAPESTVTFPVMAAQDLVGAPRAALSLPHLTSEPGRQTVFDRMEGRAERVEVTTSLVGR